MDEELDQHMNSLYSQQDELDKGLDEDLGKSTKGVAKPKKEKKKKHSRY